MEAIGKQKRRGAVHQEPISLVHPPQNAHQQLGALFESMLDGVVVHNELGRVIQYNRSALKILGITADQLMGRDSFDPRWKSFREDQTAFPPEEHPSVVALGTGKPQLNRLMGVAHSTGRIRWLSVTAIPLFEAGSEKPYQALVTFRDVTNERAALENLEKVKLKLEERENFLRLTLDSLPTMIGYWDRNLINVHSNRAYSEYFEKTPDEIKGHHLKELVGPSIFEKNLPYIQLALRGEAQTFEREIPLKNGGVRQTLASYLPDFREGVVQGFFAIVTDISRIKTLENERREFEAKLVAASKMSSLGEMAAGIAHEINNPLAIINVKASFMKSEIQKGKHDPDRIVNGMDEIKATVERIAKTIRGLQFFARNAEKDPFTSANLSQILNDTLVLCRERIKGSGVSIRAPEMMQIRVECRPSQISQIIMNMIGNAFDAIETLKDKWIEIRLEKVSSRVKLTIVDSGHGIPPEVVDKMMQPFFTTKPIGKGTGLGLSISKGLAEDNEGTFYYELVDGHTAFVLELPLPNLETYE